MKKSFFHTSTVLLLIVMCSISCKPDQQPTSKFQLLCKTWQIEKLVINDTVFPLTAQDLNYTVTYQNDSTYKDSDGMAGRFELQNDGAFLVETLQIGGNGKFKYNVETLNNSNLSLKVVSDSVKNINIRYFYHAK
jgi:hypothetical protein